MKTLKTARLVPLLSSSLLAIALFGSSVSFAGDGTNGGGGGGAIVCDGEQPVLTDFWEASQANPTLIANSSSRLNKLRQMNEAQTVRYFAKRFGLFDFSIAEAQAMINGFVVSMNKVLANKQPVAFPYDGINDENKVLIRVDRFVADPKDSGVIYSSKSSAGKHCHEERVAITRFNDNGSSPYAFVIKIRNPEILRAMPVFDRVGLILGHEILNSSTRGLLGIRDFAKRQETSAELRQFNAWMALATPQEMASVGSYQPADAQKVQCSAWSTDSDKSINFDLYMGRTSKKTVLDISFYFDESFLYPTFITLPLSMKDFNLPAGVDFRVDDENGTVIDKTQMNLRINPLPNNANYLARNLLEAIPKLGLPSQYTPTGFMIRIERDADGRPFLVVEKGRSKALQFRGLIDCDYRSKDQGGSK